jgi:hypothetical protein
MEKCLTCRFYDRQSARQNEGRSVQWGPCRRTAPLLNPINTKSYAIEGIWPYVRDDDWCGEWTIRPRRSETRVAEAANVAVVANLTTPSAPAPRPAAVATLHAVPPPGMPLAVNAGERAAVMSIGASD